MGTTATAVQLVKVLPMVELDPALTVTEGILADTALDGHNRCLDVGELYLVWEENRGLHRC